MAKCYNCGKETNKSISINKTLYYICSKHCALYCARLEINNLFEGV